MSVDLQVDPSISQLFSEHIKLDETILWTGHNGVVKSLRTARTASALAIVLCFLGVFLPHIGSNIAGLRGGIQFIKDVSSLSGIIAIIVGIPMVIVLVLLAVAARALWRFLRVWLGSKPKQYYAITNKRAMVFR